MMSPSRPMYVFPSLALLLISNRPPYVAVLLSRPTCHEIRFQSDHSVITGILISPLRSGLAWVGLLKKDGRRSQKKNHVFGGFDFTVFNLFLASETILVLCVHLVELLIKTGRKITTEAVPKKKVKPNAHPFPSTCILYVCVSTTYQRQAQTHRPINGTA